MSWPQLDDFRWAVQDPVTCFADPDLQAGEVVCDMFGMPKVASGNFACAYEIQNGNKRWAIRTFNHEVTDQQLRYQLVSDHLGSIGIPYMVRFVFQPEGIMVGGSWYPIVKMTWVEGMTLTRWVKEHRDQPEMIRDLARDWRGMVGALYGLQMAHADLQHGNVLVTPGEDVKLIDYDGMFVPKMQGKSAPELGHPNWNHPKRNNDTFGHYLDQFPGLVGYVSLLAVATRPALLDEYCNDENLILSQADLAAPRNSTVIHELKTIQESGIDDLTDALIKWCEESVDYDTLENVATGGTSPPVRLIPEPVEPVVEPTSKVPYLAAAAVIIIAAAVWLFLLMTGSEQIAEQPDVSPESPPPEPVAQVPLPRIEIPATPPLNTPPSTAPPQRAVSPPAGRNQNTRQRPATARQKPHNTEPPVTSPQTPIETPAPVSQFEFETADGYYDRGLDRLDQRDWVGAESDFGMAIAMNSNDPIYYRERGNVRLRLGDLVGARLDYDKAISLDPRYSAAYNSRGVLRRRQGNLVGARADYDRAIALNPIESTYFRNRGNLRRQQGDLQGALEDYDQTIALNSDDSIAYNSRGVVREQQGDLRGAHADFDLAIDLNSNEPTFFQNRSNLRRQMGDLIGAQDDLDRAIALKSGE